MLSRPTERRYLNRLLLLLALTLAFNYVDRTLLALALPSIKAEFAVTDTQLGLLTGVAFATFYAVMGLPIARWADRGNRVRIIAVTTLLWTSAMMLCGFARSFLQLLVIRVGTAVGEAGCIPPAHSLIADLFSRAERPRAISRYMLGGPISIVIGYFLGGWLNQLYGWRLTFGVLALPGFALAALVLLLLREPRCDWSGIKTAHATPPDMQRLAARLWSNATYRHLLMCTSINYFFGYGLLCWQPTFFFRSYGMQTGELGVWFTLIFGLGGAAGTYLGGEWALRRAKQREREQLGMMAGAYVVFAAISTLTYLAHNRYEAFALMAVGAAGIGTALGPLFALVQTVVPGNMRAVAVAIIYFCANLIGMGVGPVIAGALSDALRPLFGDESLRYSLLALSPGYAWCGWHLWRARNTVAADLQAAEA